MEEEEPVARNVPQRVTVDITGSSHSRGKGKKRAAIASTPSPPPPVAKKSKHPGPFGAQLEPSRTGRAYHRRWYRSPLDDVGVFADIEDRDLMLEAYGALGAISQRAREDAEVLKPVLMRAGLLDSSEDEEEDDEEDDEDPLNPFVLPGR